LKVFARESIEESSFSNCSVMLYSRDANDLSGRVIANEMYGTFRSIDYGEEVVFDVDGADEAFTGLNDSDGVVQAMASYGECLDRLYMVLSPQDSIANGQIISFTIDGKRINVGVVDDAVLLCIVGRWRRIRTCMHPMGIFVLIYIGEKMLGTACLRIPGIYSEQAIAGCGDAETGLRQSWESCVERGRIGGGVVQEGRFKNCIGLFQRVIMVVILSIDVRAPMMYLIIFLEEILFDGVQVLSKAGEGEEGEGQGQQGLHAIYFARP
jgi:hypothetical protein